MGISKIKWMKVNMIDEINGVVNNSVMFVIQKRGVKKVTYVLQAWPFYNDLFPRANVSKILAKKDNIQDLKALAQGLLETYVTKHFLTKPKPRVTKFMTINK